MVDLKPCPFCGAPSELFDGWARVRCPECGALGSAHRTKGEAIAAWNNRSPLTDHAASAAGNDGVCSAGFEVHVLKTHPEPFAAVRARKKWLEIRRHDRNFKEGDTLWLDEYDPATNSKSGEVEVRLVSHVLPGGQYGIEPGFCAISMMEIALSPTPPAPSDRVTGEDGGKGSAVLTVEEREAVVRVIKTGDRPQAETWAFEVLHSAMCKLEGRV